MTDRRALLGWINLSGEAVRDPEAALSAMRAGESLPDRVSAVHLSAAATVAWSGADAAFSHDTDHGCAALLLGRPRWDSQSLAREAGERGDAAMVLRLYQEHGTGVAEHLQGRFALVVLDPARHQALLAVDRMGIERLCFARSGPLLVFSTSARAVACHPEIGAGIDAQALYEYLFCHMVPSPDTAFAGVAKLLPAETCCADEAGMRRHHYWHLPFSPDAEPLDAQARKFRALLRQAVDRQIDARPTGAFLSGGTDSSTIAGLLADAARPERARTFSIGFEADGFDELEYARITSRHFATRAHEYYVTATDVADAMPMVAEAYDEPFGNASAVPTFLCARLAASHGIEVMLAGDGGDEVFAGNERYAKQGIFELYYTLPAGLRQLLEPALQGLPLGDALTPLRKLRSYVRQARVPLPERLESYNFLNRDEAAAMFDPDFAASIDRERPLELMREAYFRATSKYPVDRMMHLDHKITLADNDLRKVTRMCEAAGVEVRFPLLDDDLVMFSGTLRPQHKIRRGALRWFFKHALRDFLPAETIRKSKHGFGLPFGLWSREAGPLRDLTQSALESLGRRGIVQAAYIAELQRLHMQQHASYYGVMLWVMSQLELWLQHTEVVRRDAAS